MPIYRVYFRRRSSYDRPNVLLVTGRQELERILGRKTPIAVAWEKAKLYSCVGCDRRGPWDEGWAWRGGWPLLETEDPIESSCSNACREKIPRIERQHWISYEPLRARERAKRQTVAMDERERAQLQRERRTVPLPKCPNDGKRRCAWCTEEIVDKRAYQMSWHRDCKRIWLLHYDRYVQADFLIERDGNDCWDCRRGGRFMRIDLVLATWTWEAWPHRVPPPGGQFGDASKYPEDLALRKVEGVIVGLYSKVEYRRRCGGLEVDHEIPLWKIWHLPDDERRPFYGPENIRLRCDRCHKAKSKREAAERAQLRTKGPANHDAVG